MSFSSLQPPLNAAVSHFRSVSSGLVKVQLSGNREIWKRLVKELLEGGLAKGAVGGGLKDHGLSLCFLFTPLNESTPLRPPSHPLEAAFEARFEASVEVPLVSVAVLVILVVVLLVIL